MTPGPSIRVNFPRYSARSEWLDEPKCGDQTEHSEEYYLGKTCSNCGATRPNNNVRTIRTYCSLCDKKITERVFVIEKSNPQDRTDEEQEEYVRTALKASAVDKETYWAHLRTAHPEEFDD